MNTATARIAGTPAGQELATVASFENGELWLRVENVTAPGSRWDNDDLGGWDAGELIAGPMPNKGAVFCYSYEDQFAATTTTTMVARYLREHDLTPNVQNRPFNNRVATCIEGDQASIDLTTETATCTVDVAQFVGSAVVAAFRVIKQMRDPARGITSLRCGANPAQPYPL